MYDDIYKKMREDYKAPKASFRFDIKDGVIEIAFFLTLIGLTFLI